MLEVISSSLIGFLFNILGASPAKLQAVPLVSWEKAEIFALPIQPDPTVEAIVQEYLQRLEAKGLVGDRQGVWIQSDWAELAKHQGNTPASAASLTKIATTLAALEKWGPEHQFVTEIYGTGPIEAGILQGDLVVKGSGDPLLVWEEAIALGNSLQKLGIRQVKGNLVILGDFAMNFKLEPLVAGKLLLQSLNASLWSPAVETQYRILPKGTPRPEVAIAGTVQVGDSLPENSQLLLRHQSLTLAEIFKQMNIYSNNKIAEMLAQSVGGATVVSQLAAKSARVPQAEIQLINGSGLGIENRISPRAVCGMLMAIDRELESQSLGLTDLFPVAGRDHKGTMLHRNIPAGTTVKTGTLNQVSALAGVLPTSERGPVWFAITNYGGDTIQLRAEQDRLLQSLSQHWQVIPASAKTNTSNGFLGDPSRNVKGQS